MSTESAGLSQNFWHCLPPPVPPGLSEGRPGSACFPMSQHLLPRAVMTVSAQKGLGDCPGQPSHLAAESVLRRDRGLPKVTEQVLGLENWS